MYQRVFILEVSGPTLAFIRERLPHLPNLRRLVEQGASGQLSCPLQPMLPNAFGTLYTGCNPGQCGLYDFFGFAAGGYERLPYSSTRLQRPTFLSHLAAHGKRVGMLNTPLLYPLPEVDGFVVSGDEDAGEAFARPKAIQRLLEDRGYRVAFGASYAPGREIAFFEHCLQVMAMRVDALRALFGARDWQFGMLTLHWIGELLHAFWKFYDPRHPDYRPFGEVFGQTDPFLEALILIDTLVGELDELVGAEGLLLVFGAWGHRLEHSTVHWNALLERQGYLKFKRTFASQAKRLAFRAGLTADRAERLAHRLNLWKLFHYGLARGKRASVTGATFLSFQDVDWGRTRAVAMGYLGQVYLNVQGHRPEGAIAPADYEREREALARRLAAATDPRTGAPLVARVWRREEIYAGDQVTHAPDLIVELCEGYSAHTSIAGGGRLVVPAPANHSSDHCQESYLFALGRSVAPGEVTARLEDIAPTVLHALGVPIPAHYDGRVLPIFTAVPATSARA